ncbi:MAG TPA: hypothetical protein VHL11_04185, partial [Phototrophicaceae bacterium]|nr:hypothetical protein [Phototrophicaceae bacterium]
MKRAFYIPKFMLILALLAFSVRSSAGAATNRYRLHVPLVNDYLAAIPELLNGISGLDSAPLVHAITTEWQLFYQDSQVDYDLAITAFDAIIDYVDAMREWEAYVYPIIQSLLDHHKIELKPGNPTLVRYRDWDIKAIPRDFSGDGQPEWILQVTYQDDLYQQWYVVRLDDSQPVLITIPLPFYSSFASYWSDNSRSILELMFHDLTGDDIPEWVIAIGSIGRDNHGYLAILQWQDGQLVDLAAGKDEDNPDLRQMSFVKGSGGPETPISPAGIGIMFADVDANGTIEVIIRDYMVFTWIPEIGWYRLAQKLRAGGIDPFYIAQQAFQKKQYKRAIQFYEQSINSDTEGDGTVFSDLTIPYTALRLTLLYSLQGNSVKAENIIERAVLPPDLKTGFPPISDLIPTAVAAYRERQSALDLCTAMYNVFDDY